MKALGMARKVQLTVHLAVNGEIETARGNLGISVEWYDKEGS